MASSLLTRILGLNSFPKCCKHSPLLRLMPSSACQPLVIRGMAGHSQFANRKHVKAAKDGEKDKNARLIVRKIQEAVRGGGSSDPKLNYQLAKVITEAKSLNVPNATVMDTIKKMESKKSGGSVIYIEARGVASCNLIIEAFTDKVPALRQQISSVLKKVGGAIGSEGSSSYAFDQKGVLTVEMGGAMASLDEGMEHAIEVGAEDVQESEDDEGKPVLRFICDPASVKEVSDNLQKVGIKICSSKVEFIPHTFVPVSKDNENIIDSMYTLLQGIEEIDDIYDNIKME